MTYKELLTRVEAELKHRREAYYDDPRNRGDVEQDKLVTILRETAALIRSDYPIEEKED